MAACRMPVPASDPIVAVTCMLLSSEDLTGKQQRQGSQGSPGMAGGDGADEEGGLGDDAEEVVLVDDPAAAAPETAQFAAGQKVSFRHQNEMNATIFRLLEYGIIHQRLSPP